MKPQQDHPEISVRIEENAMRARLCIPADFSAEYLDLSLLSMILQSRGVIVDEPVQQNLRRIVERFAEEREAVDEVVAEAIPPEHGEDGRFEFVEGFDPTIRRCEAEGEDDAEGAIDHYNQVRYIHVAEGDHVATFLPPTKGTPGRDVRGEAIPPRPGKPTFMRCDDSLCVDDRGRAVARHPGVLRLEGGILSVIRFLEVRDFADFTTGNIDFDGQVLIRRGVKDRFSVKATGDITVDGLVEAARIEAGRDFILRTGMTGREIGEIDVQRNARGVYLNQVSGTVRGDMTISREIIGCRLTVGGNLRMTAGSIIGGEIAVAGSVEAGSIGSEAGINTTLHVGSTRLIDSQVRLLQRTREQAVQKAVQQEALADPQVKQTRIQIEAIDRELQALQSERESLRQSTLAVQGIIHPKVTLQMGQQAVRFQKQLKGPVWIGLDSDGQIAYRFGTGARRSIADFAREVRLAA